MNLVCMYQDLGFHSVGLFMMRWVWEDMLGLFLISCHLVVFE